MKKRDLIKSLYKGQSAAYRIVVHDNENTPLDLYENGIIFCIYKDTYSQVHDLPLIEKRTTNIGGEPGEINITNYDTGEVEVLLSSDDTKSFDSCTHFYTIVAE